MVEVTPGLKAEPRGTMISGGALIYSSIPWLATATSRMQNITTHTRHTTVLRDSDPSMLPVTQAVLCHWRCG
jgi:hypothetical protein